MAGRAATAHECRLARTPCAIECENDGDAK